MDEPSLKALTVLGNAAGAKALADANIARKTVIEESLVIVVYCSSIVFDAMNE